MDILILILFLISILILVLNFVNEQKMKNQKSSTVFVHNWNKSFSRIIKNQIINFNLMEWQNETGEKYGSHFNDITFYSKIDAFDRIIVCCSNKDKCETMIISNDGISTFNSKDFRSRLFFNETYKIQPHTLGCKQLESGLMILMCIDSLMVLSIEERKVYISGNWMNESSRDVVDSNNWPIFVFNIKNGLLVDNHLFFILNGTQLEGTF